MESSIALLPISGLYCSGWVKHGPVGVIVTTMNEAFATAETIVEDLNAGLVNQETNISDVGALLRGRGMSSISC